MKVPLCYSNDGPFASHLHSKAHNVVYEGASTVWMPDEKLSGHSFHHLSQKIHNVYCEESNNVT